MGAGAAGSAGAAWRIAMLLAPSGIRVTHRKREMSTADSEELYGHFTFEWSVEFILTVRAPPRARAQPHEHIRTQA